MTRHPRSPLAAALGWICCAGSCLVMLGGCADDTKPIVIKPVHPAIAAKVVPPFMKGTVWEKVDVGNTDPFQVSGYGLVVNLDNSGDSTVPEAVKLYMIKQMYAHGYGSKLNPGWENQSPERVLSDKRVAIVQVFGMLPPGVRKGQSFDVIVQALPNNQTSSLAGGELYLTDLKINGADSSDPFGKINDYAQAKGFVFINPAYALNKDVVASPAIKRSLRNGAIMDGGVAKYDRPLVLRLRQPETRISRFIEQRIIARFQDVPGVAKAEDEATVEIYVPAIYRGDWSHFAKVVTHLYLESTPEALANKAKMLAAEAHKPNAPLEDISYCWEGIGPQAMPFVAPLLMDPRPDIAFAAARAAAYIGNQTGAANVALLEMARNSNHPFQLNAIEALGGLTPSAAVNHMLRELLDSDKTLVRIEAYKVLARNGDPMIHWQVITKANQKFVLDVVPSQGPPLIYATRSGMPRIAIIGTMPQVMTPMMFSAMDDRLTISSREVGNTVTIFYRAPAPKDDSGRFHDARMTDPVTMISDPDISEIIKKLGGVCDNDEKPLNFDYSEVVAILQRLHDQKKLVAASNGEYIPVAFKLQDPPALQNMIYSAPSIDSGRPQGDERPKVSRSDDPAADTSLIGRGIK